MRKVFTILCVYTFIIFICCIGETFIYRPLPELVATDMVHYRFLRGLHYFLLLLPSILLSGFTVACAVQWKKNINNSRHRFSPAMVERYRSVLIASLVFVAILAFNAEIFRPLVTGKLRSMEMAPLELENDLQNVELFISGGEYDLAYLYAQRAVAIAPREEKARNAVKRAKDELDLYEDRISHSAGFKTADETEKPLYAQDHSYTVRELMERSNAAAQDKEWFNAHYWAVLAIEACNGTDTNLEAARAAAEYAWTQLKNPENIGNDEIQAYYNKKYEAYNALNAGDNLRAYYIFLDLQRLRGKSDPDVERFIKLAQEGMENQYFFVDEAQNLDLLANSHNIYFSLTLPDGSRNVFFAKDGLDSRNDGRSIRYLKDVTIVTYRRSGTFVQAMYVPLAKVVSQSTDVFDEVSARNMGIDTAWKNVPFVMLLSVDRNTEGVVCRPEYVYEESGLPEDIRTMLGLQEKEDSFVTDVKLYEMYEKEYMIPVSAQTMTHRNTMLLPMPYSDFAVIDSASAGADKMTILSLNRFISRASDYGFASEVFTESLVSRFTYPLFVLILFIFAATVGWNYRIEGKDVQFRASWLFLIILYGFIMFLLVEIGMYLFNILNYVLVGSLQHSALFVAFGIYGLLFVLISINFMARKV